MEMRQDQRPSGVETRLPGGLRRRRALAVVLVSFAGWACWYVAHRNAHPFGDLSRGSFTDHFSHMNAARLFARVGADIWRRPIGEQGRPLSVGEASQLPADLRPYANEAEMRWIEGWPASKPFFSSWVGFPRFYPPGDLLLVAPLSAAYHFTSLSFSAVNRLLILYFLLLAHVSLYFALRNFSLGRDAWLGPIGLFFVYTELIHWSLEGFYDVAMVGPLVLCAGFLVAKRGLAALLAYCAAAFIHFRALIFAPFAAYAVYLIFQERPWRYMVAMLPWLGAAATLPTERIHLVRETRAIFTLVVSVLVCNYTPIPSWLRLL
jgi:hypothetical protein